MTRHLWNIEPPSFKVEPEYLSEEHAKQVERFTGIPFNPKADAAIKGSVEFKRWQHQERLARERMMDRLKPNMFRDDDEFSRASRIKFSQQLLQWIDEVLIEPRRAKKHEQRQTSPKLRRPQSRARTKP